MKKSGETKSLSSGRYSILRRIGSGGMGEVFLATDRNLDSKVVIKIPHASMLRDAEFAARFQLEIRSLVRLRHRSIVSIMDVGEENGVPFAVMQYLEGGSLESRLANGPIPEGSLQQWLPDVASALDFIHREGYVHRDIKPANILFDREGNAYVSDFGVAKVIDKSVAKQQSAATMTGAGMIMGTPDYMAPELIMGAKFDHRVDQYALAVTVFEALSGRRPFEAPTPSAVMVKHSSEAAPSLKRVFPDASPHAVKAVDRALSKGPSSRFESCSQFCHAILNSGNVSTPSMGSSSQGTATSAVKRPGVCCPLCGHSIRLGSQHAGKTIRCSGCQETLKVADHLSCLTQKTSTSRTASITATPTTGTQPAPGAVPEMAVETPDAVSSRLPNRRLMTSVLLGALMLSAVIVGAQQFGTNEEQSLAVAPVSSPANNDVSQKTEPVTPSQLLTITPIAPMIVAEETELSFTAKVTGTLSGTERFYLSGDFPDGMRVEPDSGRITWTPTEADGPGEFKAIVQITDAGQQKIASSSEFSIRVEEVNKPPVLSPFEPIVVKTGEEVQFNANANDPDIPPNIVSFKLLGNDIGDFSIDAMTGKITGTVPEEDVRAAIPFTVVASDSAGASATLTANIQLERTSPMPAGSTDPPTVDRPPQYFTQNKDFTIYTTPGTQVDGYTIHIGDYLGKGKFAAVLIHQSTGFRTGKKKELTSAYSIGAEYAASLTYNETNKTVRIETSELVKNASDRKVRDFVALHGPVTDVSNDPKFKLSPYSRREAMERTTQMLQVGESLKFEEYGDKLYYGRLVIDRVAGGTFYGRAVYDGAIVAGADSRNPAWVVHEIGGRFNEDGTVGTVFGGMLSKHPTATANGKSGQTNVFVYENGILIGVKFRISR